MELVDVGGVEFSNLRIEMFEHVSTLRNMQVLNSDMSNNKL